MPLLMQKDGHPDRRDYELPCLPMQETWTERDVPDLQAGRTGSNIRAAKPLDRVLRKLFCKRKSPN